MLTRIQCHKVLLISAREALLARLYLLGEASDRDRHALKLRAFGRDGKDPTEQELRESAQRMLQASCIPELEDTVLSFLYSKAGMQCLWDVCARCHRCIRCIVACTPFQQPSSAGTLKLQAIADALHSLLGQLSNVYATHTGALQYDHAELVDKAAALQKQLHTTLERFDDVASRAADIEGCEG